MKTLSKVFIGFLLGCGVLGGVLAFLWRQTAEQNNFFAADAPVHPITLSLPFPTDQIYQASPDSTVLIGTRKREPALFDISAFDRTTARKLWQLPFAGNVVGQTSRQLLVYEEKTKTIHFINPHDGKITRAVTPEPAPLASPSSLYPGMAFTDDLYVTTKPLYQNVVVDGQVDTFWRVGITAKTWETNETKWFLPPVKQIVIIEHQPIVVGDNILIVNAEQKKGEGHSYQIVSLETGEELRRSITDGTCYSLGNDRFFERTNAMVRRLDPFTQREVWRINGSFALGQLWEAGDQLTILARHPDGAHNVLRIVNAVSGHVRRQVNLLFFNETAIKGALLTKENRLLLHVEKADYSEPGTRLYDYWVCYDIQARKALWRTDFHNESISSLLSFITL